MATHQLSFINSADRVVFLNGDGSISVGSSKELAEQNEGFRDLISHNHKDHNITQEKDTEKIQQDAKESNESTDDDSDSLAKKENYYHYNRAPKL